MKKTVKTVTAHLLVWTLAVGSLSDLPHATGPDAEAASRQVWLQKKSATLTIRQDADKITKETSKFRIKKAKGVKLKDVKFRIGNPNVIKVNSKGKVTPKNMGATSVTIRVKYRYKGKTKKKDLKYKVRVKQVYKHILKGLTMKYLTYATYVDGVQGIKPCYDTTVSMNARFDAWDCLSMTLDDPTIAEIGKDGLVIGKKAGTTKLTIRSTDDTNLSVTATLKVVPERKDLGEKNDLFNTVRAEYMPALESGWTEEDKKRYIDEDGTVKWNQDAERDFEMADKREEILKAYSAEKKYSDNTSEDALNSLLTTVNALKDGGDAAEEAFLQIIRDKIVAPIRAVKSMDELVALSEDMEKRGLVGFVNGQGFFKITPNYEYYSEVYTGKRGVTDQPVDVRNIFVPKMVPPVEMANYLMQDKKEVKKAKARAKKLFAMLGYDSISNDDMQDFLEVMQLFSEGYQKTGAEGTGVTLEELSKHLPNLKIREHFAKKGYKPSDSEQVAIKGLEAYEVLDCFLGREEFLNVMKMYLTEASTYFLMKYSKSAVRLFYEANPEWIPILGVETADEAAALDVGKRMEEIDGEIAWDLDHVFTSEVFTDSYKKQFEDLVQEYMDAYREAITNSEYGPSFKKNMLDKLDHMQADCLYPDEATYKDYCLPYDLTTASEGGNLAENMIKIAQYHADRDVATVGTSAGSKPWWCMTENSFDALPSTNNACFVTTGDRCVFFYGGIGLNSIFFDNPNGDTETDVKNLGYQATTIGHEMGHAFDRFGSNITYEGILVNLWGTDDRSVYDNKVKKLESIYDELLFYADRDTNTAYYQSGITVSTEAMADLGGTEISLRILKKKYPGRDDLIKKFFRYTAEQWMTTLEDKLEMYQVEALQKDVHPLSWARTNGVASMMDDFYRVFDVTEGDAMYVAPENRVKLW